MRKCFWAAAELLCLFAIRSDRHSHIHHCHIPLDSLSSSLPIPLFFLSSPPPPPPASVFFPAPVKQHILSGVGYLNYLLRNTEDIVLCFINLLSLSLSNAPPSLKFPFLLYLCIFHPYHGYPHSVICSLKTKILISQCPLVSSGDRVLLFLHLPFYV